MVVKPVAYVTKDARVIIVPSGFVTDFATIPRFLWAILPPAGRYLYAAVIHDRLYNAHAVGGDCTYSRAYADNIMLEVMVASEVKPWQRLAIYWAVRACGWMHWH